MSTSRPRRVFGRVKQQFGEVKIKFEMTRAGIVVTPRHSRAPVVIKFTTLAELAKVQIQHSLPLQETIQPTKV